jgi:site-specific recombinase XerD
VNVTTPALPNENLDAWIVPPDNAALRDRTAGCGRRRGVRLSELFEKGFVNYLRAEKGSQERTIQTYDSNFGDFNDFGKRRNRTAVVLAGFTAELVREHLQDLSSRQLQPNTIRQRLATLSSFARWLVSHGKLPANPIDELVRPKKRTRLPVVPKWEAVEALVKKTEDRRDKALLALLAWGGLRREEVVSVNVGDFDTTFGLRRVVGKGGHEATVPLPELAKKIVAEYLAAERKGAKPDEPMFVVRYWTRGRKVEVRRMLPDRLYKLVRTLGTANGMPQLHPHAFRHSCGVELLRRTGGNLRAVMRHLRHTDIQTTTIYTQLAPEDLQKAVKLFDKPDGEWIAKG